jgi:DNA mismatch endonuclease, patch repair protein
MDVLTPSQRQLNMRRIRGRDTKPEMLFRRGLHARGLRYRLHDRSLPGRPDLVFSKYRIAVFIHGCFWHGHGCRLSKWPTTRQDFWRRKLGDNMARDQKAIAALQSTGWRVLVIWECAVRGPGRMDETAALDCAADHIRAGYTHPFMEIPQQTIVRSHHQKEE